MAKPVYLLGGATLKITMHAHVMKAVLWGTSIGYINAYPCDAPRELATVWNALGLIH